MLNYQRVTKRDLCKECRWNCEFIWEAAIDGQHLHGLFEFLLCTYVLWLLSSSLRASKHVYRFVVYSMLLLLVYINMSLCLNMIPIYIYIQYIHICILYMTRCIIVYTCITFNVLRLYVIDDSSPIHRFFRTLQRAWLIGYSVHIPSHATFMMLCHDNAMNMILCDTMCSP